MKKKTAVNFIKFSLISFIVFSFIGVLPVQADDWIGLPTIEDPIIFQPQVGIPGFDTSTPLSESSTGYIGTLIKAFYNYGLGIGGILAAVVLMAGGLIWLTSGGSSDKITQAKSLMIGSVTGLLLLFGSWIILNTINPNLINLKVQSIHNINTITETEVCSKLLGTVTAHLENGKYFDEEGKEIEAEICNNQTTCIKIDYINGQNVFACTEPSVLKCCQYERSGSAGITCENVTDGTDCPATHNNAALEKIYENVNCDFQWNDSGRNPCYNVKP
ncbi:pilin [Patescibacteria group bacterium]|nr:pilin [Patescibacteria group bacterium]